MSVKEIETAKAWAFKFVVLSLISACTLIFNDMRNTVADIGHDVQTVRENVIHFDDKIKEHDKAIEEIKNKLNN